MKKRIIITLVFLIGTGALLYGFLYKEARDVSNEASAFTVTAKKLSDEYLANTVHADAKYLNKTIDLNGVVTDVKDSLVIINHKVVCGFDTAIGNPGINKNITIKGRCIGFDELFGEVKLDQCTIK
ncbi:OB-fold putative lipoprotein [Flavobacterium cerinum]|nr:OB-fold putative lipoprotein [Flavobacterium cerinum]